MNAQEMVTALLCWRYLTDKPNARSATVEEIKLAARTFPPGAIDTALTALVAAGHVRVRYELTDAGKDAMERGRS